MDEMRKDFEAWYQREVGDIGGAFVDGQYFKNSTDDMWAAYQAGRASKAGWKMVPTEPTKDMVRAGMEQVNHVLSVGMPEYDTIDAVQLAYDAMIAAAPDEEEK